MNQADLLTVTAFYILLGHLQGPTEEIGFTTSIWASRVANQ